MGDETRDTALSNFPVLPSGTPRGVERRYGTWIECTPTLCLCTPVCCLLALSAGTTDSREVLLTKNMQNKQPIGLGMQTTSCGVGILVTEIDKGSSSEQSDLKLGDCILSIDGCVPSSPKDAVSMILKAGTLDGVVRFVVIGDDHPEAALGKGVSA